MKERPILFSAPMVRAILDGAKTQTRRIAKVDFLDVVCGQCPFGQPGDRLWVRETFLADIDGSVWYRADEGNAWVTRWRPSLFMPRKYSRITLEIISIRVERLNDIDDRNAGAEGILYYRYKGKYCDSGKLIFRQLWESIYGPNSWLENPWVWVVEFRRIEQ